MFKRIDHVAFVVKDRMKSLEFYRTHFGFQPYFEHNVPAPEVERIVYLQLGDTVLELVHKPDGGNNEGYHFCLESDDFTGDYARLRGAGVPVDQEQHSVEARAAAESGWRRAVFRGPDGELIEIRG